MAGILILSAVLALGGAVVWIALLLWAAREDGRDQERRDQTREILDRGWRIAQGAGASCRVSAADCRMKVLELRFPLPWAVVTVRTVPWWLHNHAVERERGGRRSVEPACEGARWTNRAGAGDNRGRRGVKRDAARST